MNSGKIDHKELLKSLVIKPDQHLDSDGWNNAFDLLKRHRLLMISKANVNNAEWLIRKEWINALRTNTYKSFQLTKMLVDINKAFNSNHIEAISLKGPILGATLYEDVGERHFLDLDILISINDLQKAINAANDLGFHLVSPSNKLLNRRWNYYFKWKNDVILTHKEKNIIVELHIGIHYHRLLPRKLEYLLLENTIQLSLGGEKIRCLDYNSTFLYLTYHGGLHRYALLFWLRDVSMAIVKWDLDHDTILFKARMIGIERLLGVSLMLAHEFFQCEIPKRYLAYLNEDSYVLKRLSDLCHKRIYGKRRPSFITKIQNQYYILMLKPGLRYKWIVISSLFHRWYLRKF